MRPAPAAGPAFRTSLQARPTSRRVWGGFRLLGLLGCFSFLESPHFGLGAITQALFLGLLTSAKPLLIVLGLLAAAPFRCLPVASATLLGGLMVATSPFFGLVALAAASLLRRFVGVGCGAIALVAHVPMRVLPGGSLPTCTGDVRRLGDQPGRPAARTATVSEKGPEPAARSATEARTNPCSMVGVGRRGGVRWLGGVA